MIVTDWQARHGLTASEHQSVFNELTSRGYRLAKITGYELDAGPRYASLWYKHGGSDWQARHGISGTDYQTAITTLGGQGFRPVDLSIWALGCSSACATPTGHRRRRDPRQPAPAHLCRLVGC
jgi:hypothetical protein